MGVACVLLVLITASVIIITVLVCLRKRNKGPDNVACNFRTRKEISHGNMSIDIGVGLAIVAAENYSLMNQTLSKGDSLTNMAYGTRVAESGSFSTHNCQNHAQ